jgi:ferredoxin hydrogenase small subunit
MSMGAAAGFNVLWLQSGGCGGCSMSLLCADTTDFHGQLRDAGIDLLWHPSLSIESGHELSALLDRIVDGRLRLDALCIEGSLLRGPHGSGRFHVLAGTGIPMIHWVSRLAARARHVVAVGSCAAWGGVTAGGDNPTDACGLQFEDDRRGGLLGADFRSESGLPVINIAGCPTHPSWVIDTLMALAA